LADGQAQGLAQALDDAGLAQSAIGQRDVRATPLQINLMTSRSPTAASK